MKTPNIVKNSLRIPSKASNDPAAKQSGQLQNNDGR